MMDRRSREWQSWSNLLFGAAVALAGCGGGHAGGGNGDGGGTGTGGRDGGGPPPPMCNASGGDATAMTLDFANNLIASPAPPGNLAPQNAPQIVVFGWDDIENDAGVKFINSLLAGVNNPNG